MRSPRRVWRKIIIKIIKIRLLLRLRMVKNTRLVRPTIYPRRELEINRISRKKNAFSNRSLAVGKLLSKLETRDQFVQLFIHEEWIYFKLIEYRERMCSPRGVWRVENYYQNYIIIKIRNARLVQLFIHEEWIYFKLIEYRERKMRSPREIQRNLVEKLLSKLYYYQNQKCEISSSNSFYPRRVDLFFLLSRRIVN